MAISPISSFSSYLEPQKAPPEDSFENRLQGWVASSPPKELTSRESAASQILQCKQQEGEKLSLNCFELTVLPPLPKCIKNLVLRYPQFLGSIDLSECGNLSKVSLDAGGLNGMDSINRPTVFPQLPPSIEELDLSCNRFSGVLDFRELRNLQIIELKYCNLTIFPLFAQDSSIHHLSLSNNPLQVFPADERLPRVNFYEGIRPPSAEARRRLQQTFSGSNTEVKPEGKFIAPIKVFVASTPKIGLGQHGTALIMGSKLPQFILDMGATPVPINLDGPPVNNEDLTNQVQQTISRIRKQGGQSIPIALLKNVDPDSPIGKIERWAKEHIGKVQGLILPGGSDVEKEFYDPTAPMQAGAHYIRSIVEFSLVKAALEANKPIYGICRGAQLLNVYLGGSLRNDGQGMWNAVQTVESSRKEEIETLIEGSSFPAFSAHHQCCDQIAPDLEVVMTAGNIPKFLIGRNPQVPVVASQVHLEQQYEGEYSVGFRLLKLFADRVPNPQIQSKL
jgi:gamma-glutamyl-gamma-aminobutyrate hydrolase PuuD